MPQAGDVVTAFTADMATLENFTHHSLPVIVGAVGAPVIVAVALGFFDPALTAATLVSVAAGAPVFLWVNRVFGRLSARRQALQAEAAARIIEYVQGIAVVRAFGQAGARLELFRRSLDDFRRINTTMAVQIAPLAMVFITIVELGVPFVLLFGSYRLFGGSTDVGTLLVFLVLVLRVYQPLVTVAIQAEMIRLAQTSLDRVMRVVDAEPAAEPEEPKVPRSHGLEFDHVSFGAKPEAAPAKRTLRLASIDPRCTINPAAAAGWATASYGFAETLTRQTLDGSIEPWLLSSSTRTSPLEWQFRLREGVRFHNGRAADAAAVVASLEARAKETHNPDPVSTGKLTVTGPLTFTLTTLEPKSTVPNVLALFYTYPIFDADAAAQAGTDESARVKAGVFTGPYRPVSITSQRIEATRFDGYWGQRPALDSVEVLCIPDAQARVAAVRSGEADVATTPPSDVLQTLKGNGDVMYARPRLANSGAVLHLNLTQPPFDDIEARRALALAIDYKALAEQAANGRFDQAHGLYATAFPWATETQTTDRDEAARILDAAGWAKGPDGIRTKNGNRLRMLYVWSPAADPDHQAFGVVLKSQLEPPASTCRSSRWRAPTTAKASRRTGPRR